MRRATILLCLATTIGCRGSGIADPTPLTVTVTPAAATVATGNTLVLRATITGNRGLSQLFEWESDQPSVAVVDINGMITAVAPGIAVIRARWSPETDIYGQATITVPVLPSLPSVAAHRTR